MIFGLIIILISVSSLQTNENSQVLKLEVKPVYNLWTGLHKYICRFNETVNCLWQNGGSAISISKYQYKYIDENGNETSDCSIIGSKNDSRKMPDSLKCIGLTTQILITAEINDVIELNCETIKRNKCSWKRNNQIVNVDQRYEYTEDQKEKITAICSIRIRQVQLLDEGNWTCGNQADDSNNAILTKRYFIRVINHSTSDKEPSIDSDSKVDKVTISSEKEITRIRIRITNSPSTTTTSKADQIILIAVPVAVVTVGMIIRFYILFRNIKKRNETNQINCDNGKLENDKGGQDLPHTYYNSPVSALCDQQISLNDEANRHFSKIQNTSIISSKNDDHYDIAINHDYEEINSSYSRVTTPYANVNESSVIQSSFATTDSSGYLVPTNSKSSKFKNSDARITQTNTGEYEKLWNFIRMKNM
ncbi:hypothetical protein CHUAL_003584 [Chamberlinius hualienensis]